MVSKITMNIQQNKIKDGILSEWNSVEFGYK